MPTQKRAAGPVDTTASPHARWQTLDYDSTALTGGFWAQRQATNRNVSLRHGYRMLEEWGNFDNLRLAAGLIEGKPFRGYVFQDSDVYKWLEAVAYELANRPDAELKAKAAEVIDLVAAAQAPDGYLDSHYQVAEPEGRWVHLDYGHELYCAGHLFQAAVAWRRATGETRLLDVARHGRAQARPHRGCWRAPRWRGVRRALRAAQRRLLLRDLRCHRQHHVELAPAARFRRGALCRPDRAHALQRLPERRGARRPPFLLREPPPEPGRHRAARVVCLRLLPTQRDAPDRLARPLPGHQGRRGAADPPVRAGDDRRRRADPAHGDRVPMARVGAHHGAAECRGGS